MFEPYRALYIHVPFCAQRCAYCDFKTQACAPDSPALDEYTERIIMAIRRASREGDLGAIETVYIGGGTPSFLSNKRLSNILYTLSLSMHLTPEVECSMECNPESLTLPMVKDLFALGVTRLSFGVQSFDNALLQTLGRIHTSERAREAITMAQERFENISIDLMCGLPGQTLAGFTHDVEEAVALGVKHVSVYPLTIEDNTPLAHRIEAGTCAYPDEDMQADMMQAAEHVLQHAGMHRYEVASYAYPGYECKHNCAYWTGIPYLGLGPGAVSMMQDDEQRIRLENNSFSEQSVQDVLSIPERYAEDLMLGMRMSAGVSDALVARAAEHLPQTYETFKELITLKLVTHEEGHYKPTEQGWLLGNELYSRLLSLT